MGDYALHGTYYNCFMLKKIVIASGLLFAMFPLFASAQTTCPQLTRSLEFGSRGSDVVELQQFLIAQNMLADDLATGYFGELTQAAVQTWQSTNGVVSSGTPDTTGYGRVGPKTRAAMESVCGGTPADHSTPASTGTSFDQQAALKFIKSLYDPDQQLLKECPQCSRYWLWSDQLLGQIVLKSLDPTLAATIKDKMNSFGVPLHSAWAALDPQYIGNTSFQAVKETQVGSSPVWYSDYSVGPALGCMNFADVAFLQAIYKFKTGDTAGARKCYDYGKAMWDGTGMKDTGQISGDYAVYKTAIGLLAQKITGFPPIGIPDNYFDRFQAQNGGIMTDIIGGQPTGSQNVETTALVLLAENPALLTGVPPVPPSGAQKRDACNLSYDPNFPPSFIDLGAGGSILGSGKTLVPSQSLTSCSGQYKLVFQADGNVVLYDEAASSSASTIWATATDGKSATRLVMQIDGNLVLYDASGNPLWGSSEHGGVIGKPGYLSVQNDGSLVIFANADDAVLWTSGTARTSAANQYANLASVLSAIQAMLEKLKGEH